MRKAGRLYLFLLVKYISFAIAAGEIRPALSWRLKPEKCPRGRLNLEPIKRERGGEVKTEGQRKNKNKNKG